MTTRRRSPTLPATLGTALGALVVAGLLDAPWWIRVGLLVLAAGLGYLLWRNRDEPAGQVPEPMLPTAPEPAREPAAPDPPAPTDPADPAS